MTRISIEAEDDGATSRTAAAPLMRSIPSPVADVAVPCDACGYDRRGLPATHPCPECGHQPQGIDHAQRDHRRVHARVVSIGLLLLLCCSMPAIGVILYSPFRGGIGGTLPALNFPGPKLWAMPLLQRAIGNGPAQAGVNGTRVAMLSLFAIWLITVAPRDREIDVAPRLRLATRWVATITFGLGAGMLLASGGIWPSERLPYWLILGGVIELPAAALLYAYLARVGRAMLPALSLHATLSALVWVAPLLIAGCIAIFIIDPSSDEYVGLGHNTVPFTLTQHRILSGMIGVMLVTSGVIATAAIMRLAIGLAGIGFPRAKRLWTLAGQALRTVPNAVRTIEPSRLRAAKIAAGLLLWLVSTLACIDSTGNMSSRKGVAGNLPFFNYVGPKASAVAIANGFGSRWTMWYAMPGVHAVLLNLLAIALITTPITTADRRTDRLATLARWWPVLAAGAIFGACQGFRYTDAGDSVYSNYPASVTSEFVAAAIMMCELPATVLLYALLVRRCDQLGLHHVARRLRVIAFIVVGLMLVAMCSLFVSRWLLAERRSAVALACSAVYGAVSAGTALAAAMSMITIALTLIRDHVIGAPHNPVTPALNPR